MFDPSNHLNKQHNPNSALTPPQASGQPHKNKRQPVTSWDVFEVYHCEAHDRQIVYQERGAKNSIFLLPDVMEELEPSWAQYLPANNLDARLTFAWRMSQRLGQVAKALGDAQQMLFVTVIVRDHTVREDKAVHFDIRRVQGVAHRMLRGCSYIGMVEGAYFTNFKVTGAGYDRAVSWHFHAIVWDVTETEMKAICDEANKRYAPAISGIPAVDYRDLRRDEVAGQALYMSKGQLTSHKVWPRKRTRIVPQTGEIIVEKTGRFTVRKETIRTGEMARMFRVFAGRYLDQIAFAGGSGRAALSVVRKRAFADHAPLPQVVRARAPIDTRAPGGSRRQAQSRRSTIPAKRGERGS